MISNNNIPSVYAWLVGDSSLLALAQNNLLCNLDRIKKIRTHTFLANNGQNEFGISHNFGAARHYSWEDTTIDCGNCPNLIDNPLLEDISETISGSRKFILFSEMVTERSGGLISCSPFYSILKGEENKRYNIKCASKFEDFDIVRLGVKLEAESEEIFKEGLQNIKNWDSPLKSKAMSANA
ncbi:MAG: hypothetical protein OEY94_08930 [Alphaproteobacteria bacterium]|nr:hypothetical protein [Alphaproteobacteria bacterium]